MLKYYIKMFIDLNNLIHIVFILYTYHRRWAAKLCSSDRCNDVRRKGLKRTEGLHYNSYYYYYFLIFIRFQI
jgi:hypothetical protein